MGERKTQENKESKRSRLVGGLDVSDGTVGYVYLDVDKWGDMNATMLPEIIAMAAEKYQDPRQCHCRGGDQPAVESELEARHACVWTKSGGILGSLKVEKGRVGELGVSSEQNVYELAKNADARGVSRVHAKWLQDPQVDDVRYRLAATQVAIGE